MTDVSTAFSAVREQYLEVYLRAIKEFRVEHTTSAVEVLFEYPESSGFVRNIARVDLASSTEIREVNTTNFQIYESITHDGLLVSVNPLSWNGIEIELETSNPNDSGFLEWFDKWMDANESRSEDDSGLSGVIHQVFIERPPLQTGITMSIDFGSADALAVIELLQTLYRMGNRHVKISSPWNS